MKRVSNQQDVDGNLVGLLQNPLSEFGVNLSAMADAYVRVAFDSKIVSVFASLSSRLEGQLKNGVIFHPLNLSLLPEEVYVGFSPLKFDLNRIKSWQFNGTDSTTTTSP